jgi:hypothetical protein
MTSLTAPHSDTTARSATGIGAGTAVVAATLTTLFAHTWGEVISMVALIAVVSAFVYGYVVPKALRRGSAGGAALTLGILAALTAVPAFWSGMPLVLGVAAMLVGGRGRAAREGAGKSITGLVLGALSVLFYLTVYVSEGIAGHTGFLLG